MSNLIGNSRILLMATKKGTVSGAFFCAFDIFAVSLFSCGQRSHQLKQCKLTQRYRYHSLSIYGDKTHRAVYPDAQRYELRSNRAAPAAG